MRYIYELHKTMLEKDLILVYEGEFNQEITKSVLSMTERNMDTFNEDGGIKRKVFNIMVESLQNICKHSEKLENAGYKDANSAIFMIGKQEDYYTITSGNPMLTEYVPDITRRLTNINKLDKQGLKLLYKDQIKNGHISERGGAGLGFIDMARKSGNKLGFDFETINDIYTFFSLKTTIPRKKTQEK